MHPKLLRNPNLISSIHCSLSKLSTTNLNGTYINQNKGGNWIEDQSKHDTVVHRLHKPCCTFVCGAHIARCLDSWVPSVNSTLMDNPNGRGFAWVWAHLGPYVKVQKALLLEITARIFWNYKRPAHSFYLLKQPPFMQFLLITRTVMAQYLPETITILPNLYESS